MPVDDGSLFLKNTHETEVHWWLMVLSWCILCLSISTNKMSVFCSSILSSFFLSKTSWGFFLYPRWLSWPLSTNGVIFIKPTVVTDWKLFPWELAKSSRICPSWHVCMKELCTEMTENYIQVVYSPFLDVFSYGIPVTDPMSFGSCLRC